MLHRWRKSLYVKLFLSFFAVCIAVFAGLAMFWNYYFTNLFYKDKIDLLEERASDIRTKVLVPYQEGVISPRELRFTLRVVARTFNGDVWLTDSKGVVMFSSTDMEGRPLPSGLMSLLGETEKGRSGHHVSHLPVTPGGRALPWNVLTYYVPVPMSGGTGALLLHIPVDEIREAITVVRYNIIVPLVVTLVGVAVLLYVLSRRLAGPLRHMNAAALKLAGGDFSARAPVETDDEVGQLAQSFNTMVDRLAEWEDTRQEFLANVSHELRSPLTTLRGLIKGMQDGVVPADKYGHYLAICESEVQRLQRLVQDLLDLASIQNSKDVFRIEPLDARAVTVEVVQLLREAAERKGLALEADLDAGEEVVRCAADRDRLVQVLQNLLYNAVQFTPAGGTVRVTLRASEDDSVEWRIADTGIGIAEAELHRIWDRFYKADVSRGNRESAEGTGLGLTIAKHLVQGMHGTIQVASEQGRGTVFTVRFPRV